MTNTLNLNEMGAIRPIGYLLAYVLANIDLYEITVNDTTMTQRDASFNVDCL